MKRLLTVALAAILAGCGTDVATSPPPGNEEYTVVSTAYPLYAITSRIGGDRFVAVNLRPEGALSAEPLTQAEQTEVLEAAILFKMADGVQPAIDELARSRTGKTITLPLDGPDAFAWLNPLKMGAMVETARRELSDFDPGGTALFKKNAQRFGTTVAMVDKAYARTLASCKRKEFVVTEAVYGPLARRYGLTQVPATDAAAFDAAVATYRPKTVFFAELPGIEEAERRKADGYQSSVLDPVVNLDDHARRGGANYEVIMGLNLDALAYALECTEESERN